MTPFFDDASIADPSKPQGVGTRVLRTAAWALKAKYTHGSLICVLNDDAEILLVRQRLRERHKWGFPGGFLSLGEQAHLGVIRELVEETSLATGSYSPVLIDEYKQPWAWHYDHLYALKVPGRQAVNRRSAEILGAKWFELKEPPPALTAATREAMRRLRSSPNFGPLVATETA